jgi:heme/copper-type cytochrome/quinol oxidase subunit 2
MAKRARPDSTGTESGKQMTEFTLKLWTILIVILIAVYSFGYIGKQIKEKAQFTSLQIRKVR